MERLEPRVDFLELLAVLLRDLEVVGLEVVSMVTEDARVMSSFPSSSFVRAEVTVLSSSVKTRESESASALLTVFLWCQVPQVGLYDR